MSEIEKLYGNAGISCKPNYVYNKVPILSGLEYPPFTAEKQLKILCFIVNNKHSVTFCNPLFKGYELTLEKIQENLAWAINRIWQDLTEEERKQIRDILKG